MVLRVLWLFPINNKENNNTAMKRRYPLILLTLLGAMWLGGCASIQPQQMYEDEEPVYPDPLEGFNRAMYSFNDGVDKVLLRPVSTGYKAVVPQPARTGVSNFFNNLAYPIVIINTFLQGKFAQGAEDLQRFIYNSTFGLAGLLDVATPMGLTAHNEDFGQTLGYWGVGGGAYIVLPLLGPSTLRDTVGLIPDYYADALYHYDDVSTRNALIALRVIDRRSRLLTASRIVDDQLDPYAFVRDAYLQRRESLVNDQPPQKKGSPFEEQPNNNN